MDWRALGLDEREWQRCQDAVVELAMNEAGERVPMLEELATELAAAKAAETQQASRTVRLFIVER